MKRNLGWLVAIVCVLAVLTWSNRRQVGTADLQRTLSIDGIKIGDTYDDVVRVLGRSESSGHDHLATEWVFNGYGPLAVLKLSKQSDDGENFRVTDLRGRVLAQDGRPILSAGAPMSHTQSVLGRWSTEESVEARVDEVGTPCQRYVYQHAFKLTGMVVGGKPAPDFNIGVDSVNEVIEYIWIIPSSR